MFFNIFLLFQSVCCQEISIMGKAHAIQIMIQWNSLHGLNKKEAGSKIKYLKKNSPYCVGLLGPILIKIVGMLKYHILALTV